tara:strand:+ start:243 stop:1154 length:912 start_codon:yes stop_codon:yes gene_type:complete
MRKHCETIWSEIVFVSVLLFPDVKTKEDIIQKKDLLQENDKLEFDNKLLEKYIKDLEIRRERLINRYIQNINESVTKIIDTSKIEKIYLTGKNSKQFDCINQLNTNPDSQQLFDIKYIKSDIYIKFTHGEFIGFSVKSTCKDTKTNYSIEKIFNQNLGLPEDIKNHRIKMLQDEFGNPKGKYVKSERPRANKLFYDKTNPYFLAIIKNISENLEEFTKLLLGFLYPNVLSYPVYEFDGIKMKNISEAPNLEDIRLERNETYETNTSAKLWYSIYLKDREISKFEIRGKNDLYKGSMQIMLYNT